VSPACSTPTCSPIPKTAVSPGEPVGLGLGTLATSLIFLGAILATVLYLTVSRSNVAETYELTHEPPSGTDTRKERIALGALGAIAVGIVALMVWAHSQPHVTCDPTGQSETMPACPKATLTSSQAAATVVKYETVAGTAITQDRAGAASASVSASASASASASRATVQRMRDDWDADATSLQAIDNPTWTLLDIQMDAVLKAYAIDHGNIRPAPAVEQEKQLTALLGDLRSHRF